MRGRVETIEIERRATVELHRDDAPLCDLQNNDCIAAQILVLLSHEDKDKASAAKAAALIIFCFKTKAEC